MVHGIVGSTWDEKVPKNEVMRALCERDGIDPGRVLVTGDGRAEIRAGVDLGSVTISRLPHGALRQRELHVALGTNYIAADFTDPVLRQLIQ